VAQVAEPHDDDGPVLREAELAADLVEQVLDVVPHAAGAVGAEVRQVLADLGGVDARHLGQALRRHRGGLGVSHLDEAPQVDREAGDRRLGYPAPAAVFHDTNRTALVH